MLQVQSSVNHVPLVSALIVVRNLAHILFPVFLSFYHTGVFIRITSLVGILIIQGKVQFQVFLRQINGTYPSSEFVVRINALAGQAVLEEPSVVLIEQSHRERKLVGDTVIMRQRSLVVVVGSPAQSQVGTLIAERRLGKHTDESTHGIASVERTLRSAHHVNPFDIRIVEIESRLVHIRNIIHIKSYGRSIDTRTDTAYIHRCGQLRTVIRDEQVGHQSRKRLDGSHALAPHVALRERSRRNGLLAQAVVFLWSRNHNHFFYINHFCGIFYCIVRLVNRKCDSCSCQCHGQGSQ